MLLEKVCGKIYIREVYKSVFVRNRNFEFYVVKKMSINLDIFFYEKTIEIIFNSLRLIIGRPNNMIFYCFTGGSFNEESFRYLFK